MDIESILNGEFDPSTGPQLLFFMLEIACDEERFRKTFDAFFYEDSEIDPYDDLFWPDFESDIDPEIESDFDDEIENAKYIGFLERCADGEY